MVFLLIMPRSATMHIWRIREPPPQAVDDGDQAFHIRWCFRARVRSKADGRRRRARQPRPSASGRDDGPCCGRVGPTGFATFTLEVDACRVEEHQIQFREQVAAMGKQPFLDEVLGRA